jgi:hypothetical protein
MKTGESAGPKGQTKSISTPKAPDALGKGGRTNSDQGMRDSAMWKWIQHGWRWAAWLNADSETVAEIEPSSATLRQDGTHPS